MNSSRMRPGVAGTRVLAYANVFEMDWSKQRPGGTKYVCHYDVFTKDIRPAWDCKSDFTIGSRKGTELIMRLQEQVQPSTFSPLGAFDGKKNLFSWERYPFTAEEFTVPWESGASTRPKNVLVKIVFIRQINFESLGLLLTGNPGGLNPDGDAAITLNMLNVFVQATPKMQAPRIFNTKSFFSPIDKHASDRIRPLELWRGYFQSIRPSLGRVLVNVDVTIGVVIPAGSLERIGGEYLRLRDLRQLSDLRMPDFQKLRLFLRGMKVVVDLPSHRKRRQKTIKELVRDVGAQTFEKGGVKITVADHFKQMHNIVIRPRSLGVRIGQDGLFPIEVVKVIQQLSKNRSSPEIVREALEFSPPGPQQRIQAIQAGWEQLQYEKSQFLSGAGITVRPNPVQVRGRTLPTLAINFGRDNRVTPQRSGVWDVMHKTLYRPASIGSWMVVDFAAAPVPVLDRFIKDLTQAMNERGMKVDPTQHIVRRDGNVKVADTLFSIGREVKPRMILVILPESAAHLYREVKRFGDITVGVVTQCVKWSGKLSNDAKNGRCNQYHNNLILKINAKLGGINYVPVGPAMEYLRERPTMILGADVSHPGPGSTLPSVSALVASLDSNVSVYAASIRVQESRTEIIEDLQEMFEISLATFKEKNKILPGRIFFFRDGVSEGEFAIVREQELNSMKVSIQKEYGPDDKMWPQVNFIIVGKRHHFRFFPMNRESGDFKGNGNLHAGFVVDQDIVHPVYEDFYLQSQPGLKGTSRPSHYTVLRNGSKLGSDQLQQIAYALCHCYSRSTRSVKIPAPVYYADLVCRRAKFHFDDQINYSEDMSAHSDERAHVDFFKEHFSNINSLIKDKMYFV